MHCGHWLDVAGFVVQCLLLVVQCLLLGGLIWYTIETHRMRKTAQGQFKVAQEQIETTQKPCVTFSTTARNYEEAVVGMHGADGVMVVHCPAGLAQLDNVGFGPAVNVRYELTPTDPAAIARPRGYLVGIRPGEHFSPPIPRELLVNGEWQCVLTYESLSGRRYRTTVTLNHLVLTSFHLDL